MLYLIIHYFLHGRGEGIRGGHLKEGGVYLIISVLKGVFIRGGV